MTRSSSSGSYKFAHVPYADASASGGSNAIVNNSIHGSGSLALFSRSVRGEDLVEIKYAVANEGTYSDYNSYQESQISFHPDFDRNYINPSIINDDSTLSVVTDLGLEIVHLDIVSGGSGYSAAGTLTATGGDSSFSASYTVELGSIDTVTIIKRGTGFTSQPTIVISDSGGTGAIINPVLSYWGTPGQDDYRNNYIDRDYPNYKIGLNNTPTAHDTAGKPLTLAAGNTTAGGNLNVAGGALTLQGGQGKGAGAGGDIIFKTANAGSSSSFLNPLATALTISDDLSSTFAGDVSVSGNITVAGNTVYSAGGTDVPVADGGTGASTLLANAILTGNGTSAIQAETDLLFDSNNLYPRESAHNATGTALTVSAGDTTAGTTNNIAGGALTLEGGLGKGSGAGGDIVFKTSKAGSSGSALNSLTTALTIDSEFISTFSGSGVGTIKLESDATNYATFSAASNGATTITTVDSDGAEGHLNIQPDGHVEFDNCAVGFDRLEATFSATGVIGSGGTDDTDIDFRLSNKYRLEMTGDIVTMNLIFPATSGNFLLVCATNGDHDVTNWKAWESDESAATTTDVMWAGGSVPAFTSSGVDIVSFYWDSDEQQVYGIASLAFAAP